MVITAGGMIPIKDHTLTLSIFFIPSMKRYFTKDRYTEEVLNLLFHCAVVVHYKTLL